jgi:hypothetical protein
MTEPDDADVAVPSWKWVEERGFQGLDAPTRQRLLALVRRERIRRLEQAMLDGAPPGFARYLEKRDWPEDLRATVLPYWAGYAAAADEVDAALSLLLTQNRTVIIERLARGAMTDETDLTDRPITPPGV